MRHGFDWRLIEPSVKIAAPRAQRLQGMKQNQYECLVEAGTATETAIRKAFESTNETLSIKGDRRCFVMERMVNTADQDYLHLDSLWVRYKAISELGPPRGNDAPPARSAKNA